MCCPLCGYETFSAKYASFVRRYLVTASSDHSARLWDLQSGAAIRYYSGHSLAVTCCALNDSSTA